MTIAALPFIFHTIFISAACPLGVSDILTQSIWTSMESWKDEDGDGVFVLEMDSCQADNNWLFRADSTLVMTEDALKCEPDMPYLDTITCGWFLKNDETVLALAIEDGGEELDFQIFAVGEHELVLHIMDSDNPTIAPWEKIILRR